MSAASATADRKVRTQGNLVPNTAFRNRLVRLFVYRQETTTEMKPVKAAILSLVMLSGLLFWGVGVYSADASSHHRVVDGYGVVSYH
jgi:hypothetical protein